MAFTVTARHSGNSGTSSAQTRATNSTTPTANSLFLVCWGSQNDAVPTAPTFQTPTGGGLTYTQVRTAGDSTSYPWDSDDSFRTAAAVYRADVGASPSAFTVTVDSSSGSSTFYYGVVCLDITGHDSTSPIVGTPAIAGGSKSVGDTETGTVTLGATPTAGNLIVVVFASGADSGGGFAVPTAGAGKTFTAVTNQDASFLQTGVFYRVADGSESTTITCSDLGDSVGNYAAIAFEVQAAAGSQTVSGSMAATASITADATVLGSQSIAGSRGTTASITASANVVSSATATRTVTASVHGAASGPERFITQILGAGNQQYPADQTGDPILVRGDVIWGFPANAGRWNGGDWQQDITDYLDVRQGQGFNLLMIGALGSTQNGGPADTGATHDGVLPFSGGNGVLNDTYWDRVDYIIDQAALRGITVLLNVAYSYDMDDGALDGFSNANFTTYGTNLGNRYKTKTNLIWGVGGDYFDTQTTQLGNLFTAIEATGDTHLKSVQNYPETTSRKDISNDANNNTGIAWSDWNFVYSYNVTYDGVEYAYDESSPVCVIWGDGHFDQDSTPDRKVLRDLVWWALSSGARGHIYGSEGTWNWQSGSLSNAATETVPSTDLDTFWGIFTGLDGWHQLVPDTDSSFVTAGRGTHAAALSSGGGGGEYNSSDTQDQYVTASITADGTLAVVYFPVDRTITVDDTELAAGYTVRWVDPTSGDSTSETPAGTYSPTGSNDLGGPDWLLVFEASGVTQSATGTATTSVVATSSAQLTRPVTGTRTTTAVTSAAAGVATSATGSRVTTVQLAASATVVSAATGTTTVTADIDSSATVGLAPVTATGTNTTTVVPSAAASVVTGTTGASVTTAVLSSTASTVASRTASLTGTAVTGATGAVVTGSTAAQVTTAVLSASAVVSSPGTAQGTRTVTAATTAAAAVTTQATGTTVTTVQIAAAAETVAAPAVEATGGLVATVTTQAAAARTQQLAASLIPVVTLTASANVITSATAAQLVTAVLDADAAGFADITERPYTGITIRPFTGITTR